MGGSHLRRSSVFTKLLAEDTAEAHVIYYHGVPPNNYRDVLGTVRAIMKMGLLAEEEEYRYFKGKSSVYF